MSFVFKRSVSPNEGANEGAATVEAPSCWVTDSPISLHLDVNLAPRPQLGLAMPPQMTFDDFRRNSIRVIGYVQLGPSPDQFLHLQRIKQDQAMPYFPFYRKCQACFVMDWGASDRKERLPNPFIADCAVVCDGRAAMLSRCGHLCCQSCVVSQVDDEGWMPCPVCDNQFGHYKAHPVYAFTERLLETMVLFLDELKVQESKSFDVSPSRSIVRWHKLQFPHFDLERVHVTDRTIFAPSIHVRQSRIHLTSDRFTEYLSPTGTYDEHQSVSISGYFQIDMRGRTEPSPTQLLERTGLPFPFHCPSLFVSHFHYSLLEKGYEQAGFGAFPEATTSRRFYNRCCSCQQCYWTTDNFPTIFQEGIGLDQPVLNRCGCMVCFKCLRKMPVINNWYPCPACLHQFGSVYKYLVIPVTSSILYRHNIKCSL
jgi:hypothetical protein